MGADGGIKISSVDDIKKDWTNIKTQLISRFEGSLNYCGSWELKYIEKYINKSKELPDDINNFTGDDIVNLFGYLRSCDCPYHFNGCIITGEGDNVADQMNTLSDCLKGTSIETWT